MANIPAFQASDESSILSARTKVKTVSFDTVFTLVYAETEISSANEVSVRVVKRDKIKMCLHIYIIEQI